MNEPKKGALLTVFLVVLIDLMGFGIVLPLLPFYASKFGASAVAIGLLYSAYSLMQLLFSPFWGGLSDRLGRRPIMLISTFGSVVAYLIFGFAGSFTVLMLSRLMAGVMGGNISAAQAYIADVTSPQDRARGMGLIGAAFGIGFTTGPALATLLILPRFTPQSGWLADHRFALPGLFAAALSLISFLMIVFKLPESIRPGQAPSDPTRVARVGIFQKQFWSVFALSGKHAGQRVLPLLFLGMFLTALGHSSLYSAFPLYCKNDLGLTAGQVGLQFVWMGLLTVLIQGGMIRPLVKRYGETRLFVTGAVFFALGIALIPLGHGQRYVMLALGVLSLGAGLAGPTLTSLISKESQPETLGATMGSAQGLSALGRVIGPTWGGALYGLWAQLPFLATAGVCTGLIWIALSVRRRGGD